jgi:hypothetical protein
VAPGLNRDGARADRRQHPLGSSDGTAAQGFGESWEVQRWLREGAKEWLWLRRSWGGLGMRVARATDATHPAGSLQLAQIGARVGF